MSGRQSLLSAIFVFLLLVITCAASHAVVYVKWDSSGPTFDGDSWATAYHTVQAGIDDADIANEEVWVSGDSSHPYVENIVLRDGVALFGGFAGTETSRDQRNWATNVTILDGNQAGSVVTSPSGATATTVLDGFTIRNGTGTLVSTYKYGGGIYCPSSSPTISNNTITGNGAYNGGGIYCNSASPSIRNNTITANNATNRGGGTYCDASSALVVGNTYTGNSAYHGGGILCDSSNLTIMGNSFTFNQSTSSSGAIGCFSNDSSIITANLITDNTSDQAGGVGCWYGSTTSIEYNVFVRNKAKKGYWGSGGAIECWSNSGARVVNNIFADNEGVSGAGLFIGGGSPVTALNNTIVGSVGTGIVIGDSDAVLTNNIVSFGTSGLWWNGNGNPALRNNCVYGNSVYNYSGIAPGTGDISADPIFVNRTAGNYHLTVLSPCINAGDNLAPSLPSVDMDAEGRIYDGTVDIGADEFTDALLVSTPTFSPDGATFVNAVRVTMSCSTPDAVIHYTTTGDNPTESDPVPSGPILLTQTATLRAGAWKSGFAPSRIKSADYLIIPLADNKKLGTDSPVDVTAAVVTAAFPQFFYIEADDRSSGIRVEKTGHGLTVGMRADVIGTVKTVATSGERCIAADFAVQSAPPGNTGSVKPLVIGNRAVGGGEWYYNPSTGAGQMGVKGNVNLNNIGLLVTTTGRVTYNPNGSYFVVSDGSSVTDQSGYPGIRVVILTGLTKPAVGKYVTVTGASSIFKSGAYYYPLIRVRTQADIVIRQ